MHADVSLKQLFFLLQETGRSVSWSPFDSRDTLPSSIETTPSAVFSSGSTNYIPLPDEPVGQRAFQFDSQNHLNFVDYNPPTIGQFELRDLQCMEYSSQPGQDTSLQAFLPEYFSNGNPYLSVLGNFEDACQSGTSSTDTSAMFPSDSVWPSFHDLNPVRRSNRILSSPRKESLRYDSGPEDDPAPRSSASSKRVAKRKIEDCEYDDQAAHDNVEQSRKRSSPLARRRKAKLIHCTIPGCKQTFGRENDMKRHLLSAAVHEEDRPSILRNLQMALPPSKCEICGENLSRRDARLRHERDLSCGKRTGRKKAVTMVSPPS